MQFPRSVCLYWRIAWLGTYLKDFEETSRIPIKTLSCYTNIITFNYLRVAMGNRHCSMNEPTIFQIACILRFFSPSITQVLYKLAVTVVFERMLNEILQASLFDI